MKLSRLIVITAAAGALAATSPALGQSKKPQNPQPVKDAGKVNPGRQPVKPADKDAAPGLDQDAGERPTDPPKGPVRPVRTDIPLTFDSSSHDFGAVFDTAPVTHVFRFTNTSTSPVKIKGVRATCGCTTPQLTKTLYQPGESGEINVTFNPANRRGEQHKTVRVSFEQPPIADAQLDITSFVKPLVTIDPVKTSIPSVERGVGASKIIEVAGRREGFDILEVTSDNEWVSTKVLESEVVELYGDMMTRFKIEATVSPDAPLGRIITQIRVKTNDPQATVQSHTMIANVEGELRATPDRLTLRLRGLNQPFTQTIRLQSRQGTDFDITDLALEGMDSLGAVVDLRPVDLANGQREYTVTVAGTGPRSHGPFTGSLIVRTSLEDSDEMQIPLSGVVLRNPTNAAVTPLKDGPTRVTPTTKTADKTTARTPEKKNTVSPAKKK